MGAGKGDSCGDLLRQSFRDVTAVDVSQRTLKAIEASWPGVATRKADEMELPFPDRSFDLVNLKGCLHRVYHVDLAVAEVARCLHPGGYLRLQEPQAARHAAPPAEGELERPLDFRLVVRLLRQDGLVVQTRRRLLHLQTNDRPSRYVSSPAIKNGIARVCNPLPRLLGRGDIFLIVASKMG